MNISINENFWSSKQTQVYSNFQDLQLLLASINPAFDVPVQLKHIKVKLFKFFSYFLLIVFQKKVKASCYNISPLFSDYYPPYFESISLQFYSSILSGVNDLKFNNQIPTYSVNLDQQTQATSNLTTEINSTIAVSFDTFVIFFFFFEIKRLKIYFYKKPLGSGNITLSTQLDVPIAETNVTEGENIFCFQIKAEKRSKDLKVEPMLFQKKIVLTAGLNIFEALKSAIENQVDLPIFKQLLKVYVYNLSFSNTQEVAINAYRYQDLNESYLFIPISLSFINSTVPYLSDCTFYPSLTRTIFYNTSLSFQFKSQASYGQSDALLSVFPLISSNAYLSSSFNLSVRTKKDQLFQLPTKVLSSISIDPFSNFDFDFALDSIVTLDNTSFQVDQTNGVYPFTINLISKNSSKIANQTELRQFLSDTQVQSKFETSTPQETSLLNLLSNSNASATPFWCSYIQLIEQKAVQFVEEKLLSENLPFASNSFISFLNQFIFSIFQSSQASVCQNLISTNSFCQVIEKYGDEKICFNSNLSTGRFVIDLKIEKQRNTTSKFDFSTPKIFPNSDFPSFISSSNVVNFVTSMEILFELVINFNGGSHISVEIGNKSTIDLSTFFSLFGKVSTRIGPLSANFADLKANIGSASSPCSLSLTNFADPNIQVQGAGAMEASILIFGTDICDIQVSIPNIVEFLENPYSPGSTIVSGCSEQQFISNLEKEIEKNSFLNYLCNFFVADFNQGVNGAIDNILQEFIGDVVVPLGIQ